MLTQILPIVREAGEIIRGFYRTELLVSLKADRSPCTQADVQANDRLISGLAKAFPQIPAISEESAAVPFEARKGWPRFFLIDPLDGTKDFIQMTGEFTVNVALIEDGVPTLGAVYAPALDLLYYAASGQGAFKSENGAEARRIFSNPPDRKAGIISLESRHHGNSAELENYLSGVSVRERLCVGSSLKFCYLAEGRAHVYPRFGPTMEWDVAAGDCIWRNAAPKGLNSSPLTYNKPTLKNGPFVLGSLE